MYLTIVLFMYFISDTIQNYPTNFTSRRALACVPPLFNAAFISQDILIYTINEYTCTQSNDSLNVSTVSQHHTCFFMLESLLCYMYLINNDFLYILFPTILYLMIPSRYMQHQCQRKIFGAIYIYLFTGINCCKISQVHAVFGLFYHFMHMYMLMYFKLQTIFIHTCTCILNFRPY